MRILERDKEVVYFANYEGKTEITKTVGGNEVKTGEYTITYTEPQMARVYVSPTRLSAVTTAYGIDSEHTRTIVSEKDLGLTQEGVFWIKTSPENKPNYKIKNIGVNPHHTTYTIQEIL